MTKKIIIVDDSNFLAKQIKAFMENEMGFDIVAIGRDGNDAIDLYKQYQPDLLTLDLTMPNKDGKAAIWEILQEYPKAKILVISAVKGRTMVECLKMGARNYIEKPLRFADALFIDEFKETILSVINDE